MEQQDNFHRFYRGETADFSEHKYLTDVSILRRELEKLLLKYGIIQDVNNHYHNYEEVFDNTDYRIDKNGGIKIKTIDGRPFSIITPYGTFPVSRLDKDYIKNDVEIQKQYDFEKELKEMFYLESKGDPDVVYGSYPDNPGHPTVYDVFDVRKLPWHKDGEKIIPVASKRYLITRQPDGCDSNEYKKLIEQDYGSYENYEHLLDSEKWHVKRCLTVIGMELIENGQEEYVNPELNTHDRAFHKNETLIDFVKKYPENAQKAKDFLLEQIKANQISTIELDKSQDIQM